MSAGPTVRAVGRLIQFSRKSDPGSFRGPVTGCRGGFAVARQRASCGLTLRPSCVGYVVVAGCGSTLHRDGARRATPSLAALGMSKRPVDVTVKEYRFGHGLWQHTALRRGKPRKPRCYGRGIWCRAGGGTDSRWLDSRVVGSGGSTLRRSGVSRASPAGRAADTTVTGRGGGGRPRHHTDSTATVTVRAGTSAVRKRTRCSTPRLVASIARSPALVRPGGRRIAREPAPGRAAARQRVCARPSGRLPSRAVRACRRSAAAVRRKNCPARCRTRSVGGSSRWTSCSRPGSGLKTPDAPRSPPAGTDKHHQEDEDDGAAPRAELVSGSSGRRFGGRAPEGVTRTCRRASGCPGSSPAAVGAFLVVLGTGAGGLWFV